MKNTFYTIAFVFAVGSISRFGAPWWVIAPIGALAGWLFPQRPWRSLLAGLAGGFLLWTLNALLLDIPNEGLLSGRIGKLFMGLSRWNILLLTGFLGGLVAGLGCLTGGLARDLRPSSVNEI